MLCGILFVLYTATRWEFLPQELGFGSGMTCWRRLRDWHQAVTAALLRRRTGTQAVALRARTSLRPLSSG